MALEIIGGAGSNFVRAVRMVAEEKGVPYEHIAAAPHSDEVKAINPFGQIPVMRHDGLELPESHAIAIYIDTAFDGPAVILQKDATTVVPPGWSAVLDTGANLILTKG